MYFWQLESSNTARDTQAKALGSRTYILRLVAAQTFPLIGLSVICMKYFLSKNKLHLEIEIPRQSGKQILIENSRYLTIIQLVYTGGGGWLISYIQLIFKQIVCAYTVPTLLTNTYWQCAQHDVCCIARLYGRVYSIDIEIQGVVDDM